MKLNYREYGAGQPLIILHGLFGSSDNWQTLGKRLGEKFHVFLIDQRNHGHSPWSDDFNYKIMSDDLHEFIIDHGLSNVLLIGHSMGGKVIMQYAADHGDMIDRMIVADMGIKSYPPHHDQIFKALLSLDFSEIKSRKEAEEKMREFISDPSVLLFLLKNLYWKEKGQLALRMNVKVLHETIDSIIGSLTLPVNFHDVLFIRGGASNYVLDEDIPSIKHVFPNAQFSTIEGAGHWLHAEQPELFFYETVNFFD